MKRKYFYSFPGLKNEINTLKMNSFKDFNNFQFFFDHRSMANLYVIYVIVMNTVHCKKTVNTIHCIAVMSFLEIRNREYVLTKSGFQRSNALYMYMTDIRICIYAVCSTFIKYTFCYLCQVITDHFALNNNILSHKTNLRT